MPEPPKPAGTAADRTRAAVEEIDACLPLLAPLGYRPLRLDVQVAPSPRLVLALSKHGDTDPAELGAALAGLGERQGPCAILAAVQLAEALRAQVQPRHLAFAEVEVAVEPGSPPAVRLVYRDTAGPPAASTNETAAAPAPTALIGVESSAPAVSAGLTPASGEALPFPLMSAEVEELVRFRCPGCRVRYKVSRRRAGQVIACRRCGGPITLPARSSEGPPADGITSA